MNLALLMEMAASGYGGRTAITSAGGDTTYEQLHGLARSAAQRFEASGAPAVFYLGTNHLAFPVALFGAALAGVPLIPLNYRLGDAQLEAMAAAHRGAAMVGTAAHPGWAPTGSYWQRDGFLAELTAAPTEPTVEADDPDVPAVLLYTSGTTAAPKAAVLRHRNLTAYLFATVEFDSAEEDEAALVSVPPYHIAGLANLLSNLYAGRRIVYLENFEPSAWLDLVRAEQVTNAMVVPAMLVKIVETLDGDAGAPSLRALSYGGSRMPGTVLERALRLFPDVAMVNAYGLTETSSTIALLGPDDHRAALTSSDPEVRARLGSVGQAVPGVEIELRRDDGTPAAVGETGLIFVRGDQIAGEYAGQSALDDTGWFATRDRGHLDADGYLFIEGRADDTIIRGGENIAPAEIEEVLVAHPDVRDAVVVGVEDEQWGQRIVAVVVPVPGSDADEAALQTWTKAKLRSSKTPDQIVFRAELPRTETGKVLRRVLMGELKPN